MSELDLSSENFDTALDAAMPSPTDGGGEGAAAADAGDGAAGDPLVPDGETGAPGELTPDGDAGAGESAPDGGEPDGAKPDQPQPAAQVDPQQAQPQDDLSKEMVADGAKLRTHDGHKEWVYDEARGKVVYAGYKKTQAAEEILQEDLTPEAIEVRENAFRDAEWMRLDLISGDPNKQENVFGHLLKLAEKAQTSQEIAGDPIPTAVDAFVAVLERNHPDAYQRLKTSMTPDLSAVTRDSLKEVYKRAVAAGDKNVALSAQHVAKALFKDYKYLDEQAPPPDPTQQREADLRAREEQLSARNREEQQRGIEAWNRTTSAKVQEGVEGAISAILDQADIKKGYEKFPERLNNLRIRFREEVKKAIQSDPAWKQANEQLYTRAGLAASEGVRQDITGQVAKRYAAKAKAVLDRISNKILSEDAQLLAAGNTAAHQRRQVAEQRRGPTGVSGPVKTGIPGNGPKGHVSRSDWSSALDSL
jgi:hypothetical protein